MSYYKNHKWFRVLVQILIFILLAVAVRVYTQRDVVSGQAPSIVGKLLNGKQISLEDYKGAPVLVHFWASWCGVCGYEQDNIESIAKDYPVISVAMNSGTMQQVGGFMAQEGLSFPVINDPDGVIAQRYGVKAVPISFIVDGQGGIRFVETGYTTEFGLRSRLWLAD